MIDNSHNSRSAAHSDAAVQALIDSGIRGVHASGAPQTGEWDRQWPQDLERLQKRFFSSTDQLVTLRMFAGMNRENWALARRLGLRITTESNAAGPEFEEFWNEKLLRSDNTFNHCQGWPDQVWQRVKDAGATVNVCPQVRRAVRTWRRRVRVPESARPRHAARLQHRQRGVVRHRHVHRDARGLQRAARDGHVSQGHTATPRRPRPSACAQVLECATAGGAACAGLLDRCGTLTPGKEADIVMIRTDDINLYPSNHAIGTVVSAADVRNIDTVIIGGRIRKLRGRMAGVNMDKFRQMADESRNYLFTQAGYTLDIFSGK